MELFLIDARSYRDPNDRPDSETDPKTLLGTEQLEWLEQGLVSSGATWKIVSSDVPLSVPTGSGAVRFGRDGWANGTADDFSATVSVLDGVETEEVGDGNTPPVTVKNACRVDLQVRFGVKTLALVPDRDGDSG